MGNGLGKKDKNRVFLLETCDEHDASINCMALSEDESILATGSDDKSIRLWSTTTENVECIGVLEGHTDYITSLLIQDNYVISSCADKSICKWDMSTCECVLVYAGHTSTVNKVLFAGDFLFSISYDKTVRCWDFDSGECIRVFVGHKNNISSIIFIPAEKDNTNAALKMIQENKKKISENDGPDGSDDDDNDDDDDDENENMYNRDIIITGSLDMLAKSWSFESGECIYTFSGHTGAITCLAVDEVGRLLFTGSSDHTIRSWDIFRGYPLKAHKKLLYSSSSDHTARSWIMEFGDCTRVFKGHIHTVGCILVHKGLVYTGSGDTTIRCFDAKSGTLQRIFKGHTGSVNCLKISGNRLFSVSFDGTLRVWDLNDLVMESRPQKSKSESDLKKPVQKEDTRKTVSQADTVKIENERTFSGLSKKTLQQEPSKLKNQTKEEPVKIDCDVQSIPKLGELSSKSDVDLAQAKQSKVPKQKVSTQPMVSEPVVSADLSQQKTKKRKTEPKEATKIDPINTELPMEQVIVSTEVEKKTVEKIPKHKVLPQTKIATLQTDKSYTLYDSNQEQEVYQVAPKVMQPRNHKPLSAKTIKQVETETFYLDSERSNHTGLNLSMPASAQSVTLKNGLLLKSPSSSQIGFNSNNGKSFNSSPRTFNVKPRQTNPDDDTYL